MHLDVLTLNMVMIAVSGQNMEIMAVVQLKMALIAKKNKKYEFGHGMLTAVWVNLL